MQNVDIKRTVEPRNQRWGIGIAEMTTAEGEVHNYEYLQRTTQDIIAVLLLTDDDKIVFIEQYRVPVDAIVHEVVAGLVEHGATIEATVHKEAIEEVGYQAKNLVFTGKTSWSAGSTSEKVHTYLGTGATYVGKKESGEFMEKTIKTHAYSFEEFCTYVWQLLRDERLQDSKIGHILHTAFLQGVPEVTRLYTKLGMTQQLPKLAETQHTIWADRMKHLFSKWVLHTDGSFTIDADAVARWQKEIETPYQELTSAEQESDQDQVNKMIAAL